MAPGDFCHGPRSSLAGLGPVALEYRSCHWPCGSAGSPQCVRPMWCWFFPVPRPSYVCAVSWATWLLFTSSPARCVALRLRRPGPLGSCSPVRPLGALLCSCGVLGHLASVQRCARVVRCVASAVSSATWLCSPVRPLGVLFCVLGVLGYLAPTHECARWMCCVVCAVFRGTGLLFSGVPARCVALCVLCLWPLGPCSPLCPLGVLCCVCGVLGHLAPVHRCARVVCCVVSAVSWATWLLFTGAPAWFVVLLLRCPGPLGSVHWWARSVYCVACWVSWATWLQFTSVPAGSVVLYVRCSGARGSCSPVCPLGVLLCVCGVLGQLAPVHLCARSVCCVACVVSWVT